MFAFLSIFELGLIVVLGASAGVVIWWKLRKRTKAREVVRDTADLEKMKKEFSEVVERNKKSKAAIDRDEAAAQKLTERMLELEARLNRKNRKNAR
jgi:uncharacterized protein HemX